MSSIGVLFLLLFISSIPAIAVFVWFHLTHYPFSVPRFSFSLLAGAASFFPALFFQSIFITGNQISRITGKWSLVTEIFVRIALTEELSRLIMLSVLFFAFHRFSSMGRPRTVTDTRNDVLNTPVSAVVMASAAGLIAGLGFAILEGTVYGASNPDNTLLRIFTATPLHGACGFRVGASIAMFRKRPVQAVFRFLSAVVIHGIYNFMLFLPGFFPALAAVLIALSALISCVMTITDEMKSDTIIS